MRKWTPEEEAAYALDSGFPREYVHRAARREYDRLQRARAEAQLAGSDEPRAAERQPDSSPSSTCSECGEDLTAKARFCASCGSPAGTHAQDTTCAGCGEVLTANARFCASCGKPANMRVQAIGSGREKRREFTVTYVTFYDGSGHELGPSECTLTNTRLVISGARGSIHQILIRDISGISAPSRVVAPKLLRIKLPGQAYDIGCDSRDQKMAIESWLGQAIRGALD